MLEAMEDEGDDSGFEKVEIRGRALSFRFVAKDMCFATRESSRVRV